MHCIKHQIEEMLKQSVSQSMQSCCCLSGRGLTISVGVGLNILIKLFSSVMYGSSNLPMSSRVFSWMGWPQLEHCLMRVLHCEHATRCPHGRNVMATGSLLHTMHRPLLPAPDDDDDVGAGALVC